MVRTNWVIRLTALLSSLVVGACAEGTKVDVDAAASGGKGIGAAGGSTGASLSGGIGSGARGGAAVGGSGGKAVVGGSTGTSLVYFGGFTSSLGGMSVGSGGVLGTLGGATGSGGTAISTVPAPIDSLGISIIAQAAGTTQTTTDFNLVNRGSSAVDLKTVKIRYYFTIDAWTTPVFDIDYAGPIAAAGNIKAKPNALTTPQTNADRYFELTFAAASATDTAALSLGATGETRINTRLHEQSYGVMVANNDYSYVGATGFTDRITVYVNDQLVWGVEPGTASGGSGGAGGTDGSAGAAGSVNGGGSSTGGSSNTSPGTAGSTSGGVPVAGASPFEAAGTAGSS